MYKQREKKNIFNIFSEFYGPLRDPPFFRGCRGPKNFEKKNIYFVFSLICVPKGIQIHMGWLTFPTNGFYRPQSRGDNTFGSVCLSVCLFVRLCSPA